MEKPTTPQALRTQTNRPTGWIKTCSLLALGVLMSQQYAIAADKNGAAETKKSLLKAPQTKVMVELMEDVAELALPKTYEKSRHWGDQKERFNGLKWRRKGILIQVKRQKKLVNHGSWTRYKVDVDPKKPLKIKILNIHQIKDNQLGMTIVAEGRVHGFAKYQRWDLGVRMLSVDADCDATFRVTMNCAVELLNHSKNLLVPHLEIAPVVKKTSIQLKDFRLQRIGKVDGFVAKELGKSVKGLLQTQIRKREGTINQKINKAIAKEKDKLSFSTEKFVKSQWSRLMKDVKAIKVPEKKVPEKPVKKSVIK